MTILEREGNEVRGEHLILPYRKMASQHLVPETSGHRAIRAVVKGGSLRARLWISAGGSPPPVTGTNLF